jgi:Ca2+-binding RTX toxin-like protein
LTSLTSCTLVASNSGTINEALTSLFRCTISLDATGQMATAQIGSFTSGVLEISTTSRDFSRIADFTSSTAYVNGGATLALPNVTVLNQSGGGSPLQAYGAGSVLDLSHVTTFTGNMAGGTLFVQALAGGAVNLSGLTTYTGGSTYFQADGTGSHIDLTGLTSLTSSTLVASNLGAMLLTPQTLSVLNSAVSISGGGTVTLGTLQLLSGSYLTGNGVFSASVVNSSGTVYPGGNFVPGQLTIQGNFSQEPGGTLSIDLGGTTLSSQFDQLQVTGTATLDGTLNVNLINGFLPNLDDRFVYLSYASINGDFATVDLPGHYFSREIVADHQDLLATGIAVTNTNDSGAGSLRQALLDAESHPGSNFIYFNIPGGSVHTLQPLSPLPTITDTIVIDGTTQPGFMATPVIQLDGSQSGGADGLTLTASNSVVRGLDIGGFHNGIVLTGGSGDVLQGDYVGVDPSATTAFANSGAGIVLDGASNNTLGGTTFATRLIVSANGGDGIDVRNGSNNNTAIGNYIGTDVNGTGVLGNGGAGVFIADSSNNTVGGTAFNAGNIIVNNTGAGIAVTGTSTGDALRGNVLHDNVGLGIDLGNDGVTQNDTAGHVGPNNFANFPFLQGLTLGSTTVVSGQLQSTPNTMFTLDFYASPTSDPSGHGPASRYLGAANVSTDRTGLAAFNLALNAATVRGEYLTATATDPAGNTSELAASLLGTAFNYPPSVSISGPGGLQNGTPVAYQSGVSDPDTGETFTYAWNVTQDGNPAFALPGDTITNQPTLMFTPLAVATYHITLSVTDNYGGVGTATTSLVVTRARPSVLISGAPATTTPFTTVNLTGMFDLPPNTTLAEYSWSASLNGFPFSLPPSGTDLNGNPTQSFTVVDPGLYVVTLTATDSDGGVGGGNVGILNTSGLKIVGVPAVGQPDVAVNLTGIADDGNLVGPLSYAWTVTQDGNLFASQTGADTTFSFTPELAADYAVSLTITDSSGKTVSGGGTFNIPNTLTIINVPQRAFTGQTVALQATGYAPSDPSTVHWAVFGASGQVLGTGDGPDFSYVPTDPGQDFVAVTSPGRSTSAVIPVFVPSLTVALSTSANPSEGSPVMLTADLSGATPGTTYTYQWTVTDRNGRSIANGPGTPLSDTSNAFTFTSFVPGTFHANVIVTGNDFSFGSADTDIVVVNVPPTVTIQGAPATSIPEGTFVHLVAAAADPGAGADVLRFAWNITGPEGFSKTSTDSTLDFTPIEFGSYSVSVTVTDSSNTSTTASLTITVDHVQPVPTVRIDAAGTTISAPFVNNLPGTFTLSLVADVPNPGADVDNFQYAWTATDVSSGSTTVQSGSSPDFVFSGVQEDTYTVTLEVTDEDGGDQTITVPVELATSGQTVVLPAMTASQVLAVANDGAMIDGSALTVPFVASAVNGSATLIGGAGPNVLQGDSGFNVLEGGSGANTLYATSGDTLYGGTGSGVDLFALIPDQAGQQQATIQLRPNAARTSTLNFAQMATGISIDLRLTGGDEQTIATGERVSLFGQFQNLVGTAGDDSLIAGNGSTLFGGGGNDTLVASGVSNVALIAGGNDDLLRAQASADNTLFGTTDGNPAIQPDTGASVTLFGSGGNASLSATNSTSVTLVGGSGNTTLSVSGGSAITLFGGGGNSSLMASGGTSVSMSGGSGNSTLMASGGTSITLFGSSGNDSLSTTDGTAVSMIGGSGNSTLTVLGGTSITLFGGSGNSSLMSSGGTSVSMSGGSGNSTLTASGGTSITLFGGSGNDSLAASDAQSALIIGGSGDMTLSAIGGTSITLFGGSGNSSLMASGGTSVSMIGGSGNSTLTASGGTSITLFGGSGNDSLTATDSDSVTIVGGSGDSELAVINSTSVTLFGGSGQDTISSTNGTSVSMIGGSGNSTLMASGGTSITLFGGGGNSSLMASGGTSVSMVGGSGNSTLTASGGTSITLFGGSGNDSLSSTNGTNVTMIGGSGDSTLVANGGTSITLFGGSGNSSLMASGGTTVSMIGGSGNSTLTASGGTSITLFGGSGNDSLTATDGTNVTMIGGSGSSTLVANGGTSITLFGGSGNSSLMASGGTSVSMVGGSGNSTLTAGGGTSITLFGGSGNDSITSSGGTNVTMIGGSGDSTLVANNGTSITLFGGGGNSSLMASGGTSVSMVGGSGNSTLTASGGTSITLFGGSGNDSIASTNGTNVTMVGGTGNSTLTASGGTSITLFGGTGDDSIVSSGNVTVSITGGSGQDTISSTNDISGSFLAGGRIGAHLSVTHGTSVTLVGGAGNDTLTAVGGTAIGLYGLDGDNLYEITGRAADPIDVALNDLGTFGMGIATSDGASEGRNTISFPGVTTGITLDLSNASAGTTPAPAQQQSVAPGITLSLTGLFQNVIGTPGDDAITGNDAANVLQGGNGNDTLTAGTGPATLVAGAGNDVLNGSPSGTVYRFAGTGLGSATINSSSATVDDTLDFAQLGGPVSIDLSSAAAQNVSATTGLTLTLTQPLGVTGVIDTPFDDAITGNSRDDHFFVRAGNDSFMGGGGNDAYIFSAQSRGSKTMSETATARSSLNFHAFDGPVNIDLTQSAAQAVSPSNLTLTLTNPTAFTTVIGSRFNDVMQANNRGNTLVGGGGADQLSGGTGNDYLQGGITQVVYLDFTVSPPPGYHVYTQQERDAIQQRLELVYGAFNFSFTQDPVQARQLAQTTGGQYVTERFNVGPVPGASHELDTGNLDLGGFATININPALGTQNGLVPPTSDNIVGLTATIAGHELGHLVGLQHGYAFGPIGSGIYSGVNPGKFYPMFPGPENAIETPNDLLASPASVGSALLAAAGPTYLGERDAIHLAFNDSGTLLRELDLTAQPVIVPNTPDLNAAYPLGELPGLSVPDTLLNPAARDYGSTFNVAAIGVNGSIATPSEEDFYSFTGHAGDTMTFEVVSNNNTLNVHPFFPELEVVGDTGDVIALNVHGFESADPTLLDVQLPSDGTYYVGVDALNHAYTGDYQLFMYRFSAVVGGATAGAGVVITDNGGNDTLLGTSGNDTFRYTSGSTGSATVQASSGADLLDLSQSPGISVTVSGTSSYGSLTIDTTPTVIGTTTQLAADVNPAVFGQAVTLTATIVPASGSGTPSGTVDFLDTTTGLDLGTVALLNGAATLTTSTLSVGSHSIAANYSGDSTYLVSSGSLSETVNQAATATALAADVAAPVFGQSITFTATVSVTSPGAGAPSGTVQFQDGGAVVDTEPLQLVNGQSQASFTTTSLAVGGHTITANYSGDGNFLASTGTLSTTVAQANTTTALSASVASPVYGQAVTFTASVSVTAPGAGAPTGTVAFKDNGQLVDTETLQLVNGQYQASYTTSGLAVGSHTITAGYSGDGNFQASSGDQATTISQATTSTALSATTAAPVYGQAVTYSATISVVAPGAGAPSGTVQFLDGGYVLDTESLQLVNGQYQANFTTSGLAVGAHTITASYSGDGNFLASSGNTVTTVSQAATTTGLVSSVSPAVYGQPVTFTATVSITAPGAGTPTGTVQFQDGNNVVDTETLQLVNGQYQASYQTSSLSVGTHTLTASYSGDGNFTGSTSSAVNQAVNPAATTTALTSSANPSVYGQSVTLTATVQVSAPGGGTPTGVVNFYDGNTLLGSGSLAVVNGNNQAAYTTSALSVATHSITATYQGDTNFTTSTSGAVSQVVNQDTTTTSLSSSANPSVYGQGVTFTATVSASSPGSGTPTGTVNFYDGNTLLGSGILSVVNDSDQTSYSTSTLNAASHSIAATYVGDTNFSTSTSSALSQTVNQAATTTAGSVSGPGYFGQVETFTATVTTNAPSQATVIGTVDFFDTTTNLDLGTIALSGGNASLTTTMLPTGTQTIKMTYNGNSNFITSNTSVSVSIVTSIFVMNRTADNALDASNTSVINIPGVVFVDSSSSSALRARDSASITGGAIQVVGGVKKLGNATLNPPPVTGVAAVADPWASLAAPTSGSNKGSISISGTTSKTIDPGIYTSISVSGHATLILNPGIYAIAGGGLSISGNGTVKGSGVLIYNAGSNYPGSGGTFGSINLTNNAVLNISAATTGNYAGVAIFQSRDNALAISASNKAVVNLQGGLLYAIKAQLTIGSNAAIRRAPLIVDQVGVSGSGVVKNTDSGSPSVNDSHSHEAQLASLEWIAPEANASLLSSGLANNPTLRTGALPTSTVAAPAKSSPYTGLWTGPVTRLERDRVVPDEPPALDPSCISLSRTNLADWPFILAAPQGCASMQSPEVGDLQYVPELTFVGPL